MLMATTEKFFEKRNLIGGGMFVLMVWCCWLATITEAKCPSKANSFCLQVDGFDSILLDGSHFTDISKIFKQIGFLFETDNEAKELDQLLLINNFRLKKLERNVFCDFRFRRIVIQNCTNLQKFHRDAFNGTAEFVEILTINGAGFSEPAYHEDFFESLNSLTNLKELELKSHKILNIGEYTFRQARLQRLLLDGPIETIKNNAFFYLDSIEFLKLTKSFRKIKQHAFHLKVTSNKTLDIYVDAKVGSFERGVFMSTPRPLTINLYLNKLVNFDAAVFRPLLMLPIKHEIIMHGNPKEMHNPCSLLWLFKSRHKFKGIFQFKHEPMIDESYFDHWRCSEQVSSMDDDHSLATNNNNIVPDMNNNNQAGIDASHNLASSIAHQNRLLAVLIGTIFLFNFLLESNIN